MAITIDDLKQELAFRQQLENQQVKTYLIQTAILQQFGGDYHYLVIKRGQQEMAIKINQKAYEQFIEL